MFNVAVYRNPKPLGGFGFNLTEHEPAPRDLTDLLPWAFCLQPGLIVNKDGAFMKVVGFRGPDLASSTPAQLVAARGRLNNAIRRLGSRWCLHIEARRHRAPDYPVSSFPDSITQALDDERRQAFARKRVPTYESAFYFTFTYLPPDERIGRAEAALLENARRGSLDDAYTGEKIRFLTAVESVVAILEGFMPHVRALSDEETLTYLHDCISDRPGYPIACPELPFGLDGLLRDTPFLGGLEPQLGRLHLRTIGINAYPGRTTVGLLDALNNLPFSYRWVTRYLPLDKQDATKTIGTMKREWFSKRKGMWTLIKEAITNQESRLEDSDATNKASDADGALQVLGADLTSFGFVTPTITIWDESLERLDWKRRSVQQVLDQQGLVSRLERENAVEAWLSSLPGHAYANCRRPLMSALNIVDIMPVSAVWAGPAWDDHLDGPPHVIAKTTGSTPFRLSLTQGDVRHAMIAGPTGAGKSVLLNILAAQFRRYPNAQVFIFDKGASARGLTLLVGGQYYPLGDDESPIALQPLENIDDEADRIWASEWLTEIIERQKVPMTPERKTELWSALTNLASSPPAQRTLTILRSKVQDRDMKAALDPFTMQGPHGRLLDAAETTLGEDSWQCFEMEALYNRPQAIAPTLGYLFHRLESRFDGRPTLLILDEAWLFLDDAVFAAKIREWLKTLRRRNVGVVFASQSLDDIANSKIASALIENCPTRIFLPNDKAMEPTTVGLYRAFGLSDRQIQLVSQATPKRDYYYQSRAGNRMFDLGLSRFAIAACGSSSKDDLKQMDGIIAAHGAQGFARAFLAAHGFQLDQLTRLTEGEIAQEEADAA